MVMTNASRPFVRHTEPGDTVPFARSSDAPAAPAAEEPAPVEEPAPKPTKATKK